MCALARAKGFSIVAS
jgi:hypothetical protein